MLIARLKATPRPAADRIGNSNTEHASADCERGVHRSPSVADDTVLRRTRTVHALHEFAGLGHRHARDDAEPS